MSTDHSPTKIKKIKSVFPSRSKKEINKEEEEKIDYSKFKTYDLLTPEFYDSLKNSDQKNYSQFMHILKRQYPKLIYHLKKFENLGPCFDALFNTKRKNSSNNYNFEIYQTLHEIIDIVNQYDQNLLLYFSPPVLRKFIHNFDTTWHKFLTKKKYK